MEVDLEMEMMAVRRRQRRRPENGGVARTAEKNPWPGQGVAAA